MKFSKHAWILCGIALAFVLVLAFMIPFVKTSVYWIGLLCTVAMFGVCAFAFVRAFRKGGTLESKLLGWPIFKVGYVALIVQIIAGFTLMRLAVQCPVWIAVITEVIVFAVAGFSMTVKDAVREAVTAAEAKVIDNTAVWKAIRVRANAIAAATGNLEIQKLAEEIRYADPTPTSMDDEIAQILETLSACANDENIRTARVMIIQRNALAKSSKQSVR